MKPECRKIEKTRLIVKAGSWLYLENILCYVPIPNKFQICKILRYMKILSVSNEHSCLTIANQVKLPHCSKKQSSKSKVLPKSLVSEQSNSKVPYSKLLFQLVIKQHIQTEHSLPKCLFGVETCTFTATTQIKWWTMKVLWKKKAFSPELLSY